VTIVNLRAVYGAAALPERFGSDRFNLLREMLAAKPLTTFAEYAPDRS
jgi:hypothetical protein